MEKEYFYSTPTGKIISYAVHEAVNGTCGIGTYTLLLERMLEKDQIPSKEELQEYIKKVRERTKRINDAVDYAYKQLKELNGF